MNSPKLRPLFFSFILLLFVLAVIEGLSALTYRLLFHEPSRTARTALAETTQGPATVEDERVRDPFGVVSLHPYLGYVYDPEFPELRDLARSLQPFPLNHCRVSHEGLIDVGQPASTARYEVWITGGSVANQFTCTMGLRLIDRLAHSLKLDPAQIRLRGLALGAWQEPQPLNAINWLLSLGHRPQLILLIDGINDASNPYIDEKSASLYPLFWKGLIKNAVDLESRTQLLALRAQRQRLAKIFWRLRFSQSALLFWRVLDGRLALRGNQLNLNLLNAQVASSWRFAAEGSRFEPVGTEALKVWKNATLRIKEIATAQGARFFHFLQPTPAEAGSKPLTEVERNFPIAPHIARGVKENYPSLRRLGLELRREGVNFQDFTQIFKQTPETVYVDGCCHLNARGNEILLERVWERVRPSN